jgi:hypothetical protein
MLCIYIHTCYAHTHIHVMHIHTYAFQCPIHTSTHTHTHSHAYTYAQPLNPNLLTAVSVYMYTHTHVHTYAHTFTYTYINTCTQPLNAQSIHNNSQIWIVLPSQPPTWREKTEEEKIQSHPFPAMERPGGIGGTVDKSGGKEEPEEDPIRFRIKELENSVTHLVCVYTCMCVCVCMYVSGWGCELIYVCLSVSVCVRARWCVCVRAARAGTCGS